MPIDPDELNDEGIGDPDDSSELTVDVYMALPNTDNYVPFKYNPMAVYEAENLINGVSEFEEKLTRDVITINGATIPVLYYLTDVVNLAFIGENSLAISVDDDGEEYEDDDLTYDEEIRGMTGTPLDDEGMAGDELDTSGEGQPDEDTDPYAE